MGVNAAAFSEGLVEPLVISEMRRADSQLRQYVYNGNDAGLRKALHDYNEMAIVQAAYARASGHNWTWRGFADARTWAFIREGHMFEEWRA